MPGVKATSRADGWGAGRADARPARSAFSLIDLLVSMTIISVLIGLLLPSISGVRELTRRVICASNTRQHGLALAMFAEDYKGGLPESRYENKKTSSIKGEVQNMILARTGDPAPVWDGLGELFHSDYLAAPQVFYCPSHTGEHPYSRYAALWSGTSGQIVINYHYRGSNLPDQRLQPDRFALITDGLRTRADYNHKVGSNVLRADFSIGWFADPARQLAQNLPLNGDEAAAPGLVEDAWDAIDGSGPVPGAAAAPGN